MFVPGVLRATLSVGITPDSVVELTERFLLVLVSTNDSRVEIDSGREVTAVEIDDTTGGITVRQRVQCNSGTDSFQFLVLI